MRENVTQAVVDVVLATPILLSTFVLWFYRIELAKQLHGILIDRTQKSLSFPLPPLSLSLSLSL